MPNAYWTCTVWSVMNPRRRYTKINHPNFTKLGRKRSIMLWQYRFWVRHRQVERLKVLSLCQPASRIRRSTHHLEAATSLTRLSWTQESIAMCYATNNATLQYRHIADPNKIVVSHNRNYQSRFGTEGDLRRLDPSVPARQVAQQKATARQTLYNPRRYKKTALFVIKTFKEMGASRRSNSIPPTD